MKKGQMTLFIILGLVMVAILGFALVVSGKISVFSKPSADEISQFVEGCLNTAEICMLERMGENGAGFVFSYGIIPLEDAKYQMEHNMAKTTEACEGNFDAFSGIDIVRSTAATTAGLNKEDVSASMRQDISVRRGEKTTTLSRFSAKLPVRFKEVHSLSSELADETGYIDSELLEKDDLNVNVYGAENKKLFVITDDLSAIKGTVNYKFSFVK